MEKSYGKFAKIYDKLMFDVDYVGYVDFADSLIKKYKPGSKLLFDLACGTGTAALEFLSYGYDVLAADASEEMLSAARLKEDADKILFLNQPMQEFELYGTVDVIISMLDSINYIETEEELDHVFSLCANYLENNGLLIFDINSEFKFKNILADNTYCYEVDDIFYTWENDYDDETRLCDFYLTFFEETETGLYERFDEQHTERCYTDNEITDLLKKNGFEILGKFDGYTKNNAAADSERILYCAKRLPR